MGGIRRVGLKEKGMINVTVKYFLNTEGKAYFHTWFKKIAIASSSQEGFLSISNYDDEGGNPIVHLNFESQAKLDSWANSKQYEGLVREIETYFTQSLEVNFI